MATMLTRPNFVANRNGRPACHEYACSTSATALAMRSRGVTGGASAPMAPASRQAHRSVVRGIPVSGPGSAGVAGSSGGVTGQVTSELMESMRAKICEALETDVCLVTDVYGDGRHVSIDVVSKLFQDKNSMQRQRMVYKAIWLELQEAVHAVDSMSTKTPEEAAK